MSIIEGVVVGAETGFYTTEIEQSLRFNDDDSAYLSWTPASAGNRKTWTFSTWVKRGNIGGNTYTIIGTQYTNGYDTSFYFNSSDKLGFTQVGGSGYDFNIETSAVFRDVSSWYHLVLTVDTTQSTSSDRAKLYVNGVQQTMTGTYPSQNTDTYINASGEPHYIGCEDVNVLGGVTRFLDGYLAETHFIDGTAYDATAFGEFKNGVWIPKTPSVTYGTNGFYLPYRNDYTVEGFSAVTWGGDTASPRYIGGVGFEPDLVWIKCRNQTYEQLLFDSVRGAGKRLFSHLTNAESTNLNTLSAFNPDGFTVGDSTYDLSVNGTGNQYVAWCWDAGTGSPVSNTDGSITSTVKANPSRGFSVVSYTGTGSNATVGHGLSSAPDMVIVKDRSGTEPWRVWSVGFSSIGFATLNDTTAFVSNSTVYSSAPTSSVVNIGTSVSSNGSGKNYIAYCFHSVAGYSKMGSYTGTGASQSINTGFKPALLMVKCTSDAAEWVMVDNARNPSGNVNKQLYPNVSNAEYVDNWVEFTDTGFTFTNHYGYNNASGRTYIYMAFADTREAAFWLDDSGNNNDWENNGLTESDISLDSPTNNFATLNPLAKSRSDIALSEGNLRYRNATTTWDNTVTSTIGFTNGKFYAEFIPTNIDTYGHVGVYGQAYIDDTTPYDNTLNISYQSDGRVWYAGSGHSGYSVYTQSSVVCIAADMDNKKVWVRDSNGSWYGAGGTTGDPETNTNGISFSGDEMFFTVFGYTATMTYIANFGQDSSFAGNKTPQGYTDANGIGDFYYAPPAGYLALCTANLPEPAIGPNSATTADENFNTVLYTGDGTTSHAITGVGFQPDLVWVKARSFAESNGLFDAVRGVRAGIFTDTTNQESTWSTGMSLDSFDSDGFTSGYFGFINASGQSYVAWNWKADNTSGSTNTDGTITSTVAANVDAGFSIVSYTGNSSISTVGHGLNTKPDMVIVKNRTSAENWRIYHSSIGATGALKFTTDTPTYLSAYWNNTEPTSSVFTVNNAAPEVNENGSNFIAYCFHSVEGYSKFGSYTGNGSTDGTFVYTGFRPAFVMVKSASVGGTGYNWELHDSARGSYNVVGPVLLPNLSDAEVTTNRFDFLSNGFKLRGTGGSVNGSGVEIIYMAFAENPFKYANAR